MNHSIKVLMVDDEDRFRETTKKVLQHQGFQMILAESGAEALLKLPEHPDVVVLDIKMPDMDGHETLDEIKAIAPDLPVIMLTGHGARPSAHKALSKGAFEYLTKPCDMALLISKIRDAYQHTLETGTASATI
jgi:DNA-binding NtrC family response regulator